MIETALHILTQKLNEYVQIKGNVTEDRVVFLEGNQSQQISFKDNRVTVILVNLEEEREYRKGNPYMAQDRLGNSYAVQPEIRLNLYVLFVTNSEKYLQAMRFLSLVIQFFQANRVFERQDHPELGEEIEKLWLELVTLPFSQQNEVWNALRTTYHPSALYKVRMITYSDREALQFAQRTSEVALQVAPAKNKEAQP